MPRNPRYDLLFEPVKIGPVTAPNRFYQVPHASGMTNALPRVRAAFRGAKAEGGWGVVCTGACSVHPTSDDSPLPFARLWNEDDVRAHALMTEAVHRHGSLAGIEIWHGGACTMNRTSRLPPLSPSGVPWMSTHIGFMGNLRPRAMDKSDIRDLRRWQADGARRARSAGFDIVYVYAGMGYLGHEFLLPEYNRRTDEYGGSVANRCRFVAELLASTREAVGDACAVALRISLEELRRRPSENAESEAHEVVALLSDYTDLFDVKMDFSPTDCGASRFTPEGSHEPTVDFVKRVTDKPVVGVGRFTSPDTMVSQIRRGVLDLIGGARPSIADPFLPRKIAEGREEEIRECIGCNMCIAGWHDGVPIRCTQNPTVGEEWRRGWHPERMPAKRSEDRVLIVGGGPAGLECALSLARRGHEVALAEGSGAFGGRVLFESALPGLAEWRRVVDYRLGRLNALPNASLYLDSMLTADDVIEFGFQRVVIATGARWTDELYSPMELPAGPTAMPGVLTAGDLTPGAPVPGPVVVFDFDNYTVGGCVAEMLAQTSGRTTYVTPAGHASAWTFMTNELPNVHQALGRRGVQVQTLKTVLGFDGEAVTLADVFTGQTTVLLCRTLVVVGFRKPRDELYQALLGRPDALAAGGIKSVDRIGDALAPGAIVHAVHSGHRYAEELGAPAMELPYRIDAAMQADPDAAPARPLQQARIFEHSTAG